MTEQDPTETTGAGRVEPAFGLAPATRAMTRLLLAIDDDALGGPTPCEHYTLGDLVEHVGGLSLAFTWAAAKSWPDQPSQAPSGDAGRLPADWRATWPTRLETLAEAWRAPEAWQGMTQAGGVDLPGHVAALVALDELVVHGWDVARATGQPYEVDPAHLAAVHGFVAAVAREAAEGVGSPRIFGPPVPVGEDPPILDQVVGLAGRDPGWQPG